MNVIPHVAIGAAIGSFTGNIPLAIGLGIASHFVLDFIPHYDPPLGKKAQDKKYINLVLLGIDITGGLLMLFLVRDFPSMVCAGFVGAIVDLENFYNFIPIHHDFKNWHHQATMLKGLFNQGLATLLGLYIILHKLGYI